MKFLEILSSTVKLVAEYVNFMSDARVVDSEFGSGTFDEICSEPGNCAMVSNHFVEWLRSKKITATTITGIHAKNPEWTKNAHVDPFSDDDTHTVVLIGGNEIVDFTARQFDKRAKFPKIETYSQFKTEWSNVD